MNKIIYKFECNDCGDQWSSPYRENDDCLMCGCPCSTFLGAFELKDMRWAPIPATDED